MGAGPSLLFVTVPRILQNIPIGATLGVFSWFWIMKKDGLLKEINKGVLKTHGTLWYSAGRYLYVPCVLILCCVALFMKVAF